MTHPLTDDIIESELATPTHFTSGSLVGLFTHDDMRNAADWQLEHVIKWLKATKSTVKLCPSLLADQLEQAMRPQVVDLPQANSDVCGEEGIERALQRTFEENDELMRKLADS